MHWLAIITELTLGYILGTLVLWACSFTVNTENSTLKVAALYNAIMTVLYAALMGLGFICLFMGTDSSAIVFFITTTISAIVSFILLMRLYSISVFSTIWLVIAMWAVSTCAEKLTAKLF
jgi:uncharacterized membrane protein YjjP (DUF1212 family)